MVLRAIASALLIGFAAPMVVAQTDPPGAVRTDVLTVDPDRLFTDSQFGKASIARLEAAQNALLAENKKLEAALEAEEKELTDRRPGLPPAEFRKLADAFDQKAEEIRNARLAKSRSLTTQRDEDRQKFLSTVVPILADMMGEMGAIVILDKKTVFLSFDRADVTDRAIARIDATMDENLKPKPAPTAPQPPAPLPPAPEQPAPVPPAPAP